MTLYRSSSSGNVCNLTGEFEYHEVYIYVYVYICIYTYIYIYVCMFIYIYIDIYIYIYIYIYTFFFFATIKPIPVQIADSFSSNVTNQFQISRHVGQQSLQSGLQKSDQIGCGLLDKPASVLWQPSKVDVY